MSAYRRERPEEVEEGYVDQGTGLTFPNRDTYTTGPYTRNNQPIKKSSKVGSVTVQKSEDGIYNLAGPKGGLYDISNPDYNDTTQITKRSISSKIKLGLVIVTLIMFSIGIGIGVVIGNGGLGMLFMEINM